VEQITFLVTGSSADPYEVTFIKDDASLTALCSCPAGTYGNFCKHRIQILDGNFASISSDNADRATDVLRWLKGTDVESALLEMRDAEKSGDSAEDALAAAKKKLARAMNS